MTYTPQPIDTSKIDLSADQRALIEALSESVHDVWAQKRISEGWRHGPKRDDDALTHPSLVPYADLPDSERDYDRTIVEQVVKSAIALGYRIEKPAR